MLGSASNGRESKAPILLSQIARRYWVWFQADAVHFMKANVLKLKRVIVVKMEARDVDPRGSLPSRDVSLMDFMVHRRRLVPVIHR